MYYAATYNNYITQYYWTIGTPNRGGARARCVTVIVDGDTDDTEPRLMRHVLMDKSRAANKCIDTNSFGGT